MKDAETIILENINTICKRNLHRHPAALTPMINLDIAVFFLITLNEKKSKVIFK